MTAPKQHQIEKIIALITISLSYGRPVGVSCSAGLGRTGTILACYLVSRGLDADAAINRVRMKRPGSIETREQVFIDYYSLNCTKSNDFALLRWVNCYLFGLS
jgi:atypical dual specificity phosphatase